MSTMASMQDVSTTDTSDPTIDTMLSVGDEQEVESHHTRAQRVHQSHTLAPVFRKINNY
jgi:hypothetical protein